MDFVGAWSSRTGLSQERFIRWLGISRGKFFDWKQRYGKINEHNASIPRDHWLEPWERQAILTYQRDHPLEGCRRMTFMMLDADVVAVSPATTYRVLHAAGLLDRWNPKPTKKGTGFEQPARPHEHWHIDIAYLNIAGTFYYLCSVLETSAARAITCVSPPQRRAARAARPARSPRHHAGRQRAHAGPRPLPAP